MGARPAGLSPVWVLRPPADPVCGTGESGAEASGPAGRRLPSQRPAPARLRRAALGECAELAKALALRAQQGP